MTNGNVTWNYRIIWHPGPPAWFGLHEVYYDEAGNPNAFTADPVSFVAEDEEGTHGITSSLEQALRDAKHYPTLKATDFPPSGRN